MIVGEVALQDLHRVVAYLEYGDQLHLAHNFVFIDQDWGAERYADLIADFEKLAEDHAWPAWFLANHDKNRPRSRFDHDGLGEQRQRAILVMLYTLRGTPFIYQGEELGLPDAHDPARPDRRRRRPRPRARTDPVGAAGARLRLHHRRTTRGSRSSTDAATLNAATQRADPDSTLALTIALAELRASTPALITGTQELVDAGPGVIAYTRDDAYLVAINGTDEELPLLPAGELVLSSDPARKEASASLMPSEALILSVTRRVTARSRRRRSAASSRRSRPRSARRPSPWTRR